MPRWSPSWWRGLPRLAVRPSAPVLAVLAVVLLALVSVVQLAVAATPHQPAGLVALSVGDGVSDADLQRHRRLNGLQIELIRK